jgi:hypothetical protein
MSGLTAFIDNSKIKIGNKMYGTNLIIHSFEEKINENNDNHIILTSGGVFNKEVQNQLRTVKNI